MKGVIELCRHKFTDDLPRGVRKHRHGGSTAELGRAAKLIVLIHALEKPRNRTEPLAPELVCEIE